MISVKANQDGTKTTTNTGLFNISVTEFNAGYGRPLASPPRATSPSVQNTGHAYVKNSARVDHPVMDHS